MNVIKENKEIFPEGTLYKQITIDGNTFNIIYGYNSESEREMWDPVPIYPDFVKNPTYTKDGKPYARADQDICEKYCPKPKTSGENWCYDCIYYKHHEELLGVCHCEEKNSSVRQNE